MNKSDEYLIISRVAPRDRERSRSFISRHSHSRVCLVVKLGPMLGVINKAIACSNARSAVSGGSTSRGCTAVKVHSIFRSSFSQGKRMRRTTRRRRRQRDEGARGRGEGGLSWKHSEYLS